MKVNKLIKDSLHGFFKQDFKVERIENQLNDKEILIVVSFIGLKSNVYVVTDNDFKILYLL